jgi:hypothetical protein
MTPLRIFALVCALVAAPVLLHAQREKLPPDDLDYVESKWPNAKKSNTGIRYVVEKAGTGPLLMPGDMVMVAYTAMLLNGKVFDRGDRRMGPDPSAHEARRQMARHRPP